MVTAGDESVMEFNLLGFALDCVGFVVFVIFGVCGASCGFVTIVGWA